MKIIGVVGGIASGKSTVSRYLSYIGAGLIEVDKITHEVLELPEVADQLRVRFVQYGYVGKQTPEKNRQEIGKIVLNNDDEFEWIERLTFPIIDEILKKRISRYVQDIPALVLDCPLLFETGWNKLCDLILFVDTDDQTRNHRYIQRCLNTDVFDLSDPKVVELTQKWMKLESRQLNLEFKKSQADFVVECKNGYYQTFTDIFWKTKVLDQ